MSPLKEIVDGIHGQVAKIEDDLKVYIFFTLFSYTYLLVQDIFFIFVSLVLNYTLELPCIY